MTIPYPMLAARLFDTPLLMHPGKAQQVARVLTDRQRKRADRDDYDDYTETVVSSTEIQVRQAGSNPIYRVVEGVAIVPVAGSLVHKLGRLQPYSGMTGYDGITAKLRVAAQDSAVKGIWLDTDSFGGEVSGCFTAADEIRAMSARNGGKPIWGCINESSYSAAYALMSQCDVLTGPPTSGCGSVGVVMMHADHSAMLEAEGIKITLIHAGAHKVDGNPYQALADETYRDWLASCERVRGIFADSVAKGRGISAESVLATEARSYDAPDALKLGLIDAVSTPAQSLAALIQHVAGR